MAAMRPTISGSRKESCTCSDTHTALQDQQPLQGHINSRCQHGPSTTVSRMRTHAQAGWSVCQSCYNLPLPKDKHTCVVDTASVLMVPPARYSSERRRPVVSSTSLASCSASCGGIWPRNSSRASSARISCTTPARQNCQNCPQPCCCRHVSRSVPDSAAPKILCAAADKKPSCTLLIPGLETHMQQPHDFRALNPCQHIVCMLTLTYLRLSSNR